MSKQNLKIKVIDVKDIKYTEDNARKITEEALEALRVSIETIGVIRPLVVNEKYELMSGNQRTKTMRKIGMEKVPVVIIEGISKSDYIGFTLLVNSIEHSKSTVTIRDVEQLPLNEFVEVKTNKIKTLEYRNPVVRRDIANSIIKYGQWGNVIINEEGQVIFNSDYASAMETIGYPVTIYKVDKVQESFIKDYFFRDYGHYSYDHLNLPSFPQTFVQPSRVVGEEGSKGNGMRSILYSEIAKESFENGKHLRFIDFGSGKKNVPNHFKSQGYNIKTYEPFYKVVPKDFKREKTYFDIEVVVDEIKTIENDVRENGLYDVVLCEAVLNSTVSKQMELYVIATCNSLLNDDGVLYISSRRLDRILQMAHTNENSKQAVDNSKRVFELDDNGMYLSYRKGYYQSQKYHDTKKLKETLLQFFEVVEHRKAKDTSTTGLFFKCMKPRKLDEDYLREVLNEEFNMLYPNDYRHNKHEGLVEVLLEENEKRQE